MGTTCRTSPLAHMTQMAAMVPRAAQAAADKAAQVPAMRREEAERAAVVRKAVAQVGQENAAGKGAEPKGREPPVKGAAARLSRMWAPIQMRMRLIQTGSIRQPG